MTKRPKTPTYIVFYLLFSPDAWQVAFGVIAAFAVAPRIMPQAYAPAARILLYVMVAVVGYAASRPLGKGAAKLMKKLVLKDRMP